MTTEDPGAELLEQLTGFWNQFGKVVLAVVGGLIVLGAVGYFTVRSNEQQNNAASKQLAEADFLFKRGDLPRAKSTAEQVVKTYGATPSGLDAQRIAGDAAFWSGDFKAAVAAYKAYLAKRSSGLPAQCVRRSLAYSLDNDKQYAEAAKNYDQLVGVFDRESSAEMLTAAARCHLAAGSRDEAAKRLKRVSDEFGETTYALNARVKLAEIAPAAR